MKDDFSVCAGSGDAGLSVFVDALPTDLAMKAMVDAERVLTMNHHCQVCLAFTLQDRYLN
jgi:hypothetical protein